VVIWLQLQECTGCLESTLRSYSTGIGDLVLNLVSMQYVELLMAAAGQQANEALEDASSQEHILLINGSIPLGANAFRGELHVTRQQVLGHLCCREIGSRRPN
jgi:Ni,Fe-hydrogenase I small subunit